MRLKSTARAIFAALAFTTLLAGSASSETVIVVILNDNMGDATQHKFKFIPPKVEIKVGDKIRWINTTDAEHTITADTDGAFKGTDSLPAHKEFTTPDSFAASQKPIPYHCDFHPMQGTIVVTGN
jgi:plastocyanin